MVAENGRESSEAATRSSSATRRAWARRTPCLPRRIAGCRVARTSSSATWNRTCARTRWRWWRGLEVVPPKRIDYHGSTFTELDTDAVIERQSAPRCSLTSLRTRTCPARVTTSAGSRLRSCSTRESTWSPPSTSSTSKASTTPSATSPASACARPCPTACSTRPTRSSSSTFRPTRSSTGCAAAPSTRRQDRPGAHQVLPPRQPRGPARARASQDRRGGRRRPRRVHGDSRRRQDLGRRTGCSSRSRRGSRAPSLSVAATSWRGAWAASCGLRTSSLGGASPRGGAAGGRRASGSSPRSSRATSSRWERATRRAGSSNSPGRTRLRSSCSGSRSRPDR